MATIKTFSLKPPELELIKKRSRDGKDEFYTNLVNGYEEHGSLTEKMYAAFKAHVVLNPEEKKFLERVGAPGGRDFYLSALAQYNEQGYMSEKMHAAIVRDLKEDRARPVVGGVRVSNRLLRDGKAVCKGNAAGDKCKDFAVKAVGEFGYCAPHAEEHAAGALVGAQAE